MQNSSHFLYPHGHYRGAVQPENLVFNANLQEFSQRVRLICGLQTNGKLSAEEACEQISQLWQQLTISKIQLGIGANPFDS
jgi:hypothetical protein